MLADEPDIGTGDDPREAFRAALAALGEPLASEMAGARKCRPDQFRASTLRLGSEDGTTRHSARACGSLCGRVVIWEPVVADSATPWRGD